MEYDESRVYTALNANELKVGSRVIVADTLAELKLKLQKVNDTNDTLIVDLVGIGSEIDEYRFETTNDNFWQLAYLVSEPEEKQIWYAHTCGNSFVIDNIEADVAYFSENLDEVESWCCKQSYCKACAYYNDKNDKTSCKALGYQPVEAGSYSCRTFSPKEKRRVTYREFVRWLAKGKGQALYCDIILTDFKYDLGVDSKMVDKDIKVRRWIDDDWHEPTAEYLGIKD